MAKDHILVLDIGTTGVKALVFNDTLDVVSRVYKPLEKSVTPEGWVEQDPRELVEASREVLQKVIADSKIPATSFLGVGVTNQRETTILWDKSTGKSIYPAIVWEDTRTKALCDTLQKKYGKQVQEKTGLKIDTYFSATKINWILENVEEAKELVKQNALLFGTVDTWILWNLLENNPHVTDYTNAARTLLFDIQTLEWDKELLNLFQVPVGVIPSVQPSSSLFGNLKKEILGFSLPVLAVAGDQQASMYAAGMEEGTTKITYGTGTFIMQIIGSRFKIIEPFFTTIAGYTDKPMYAVEAKIARGGKQVEPLLNKPVELQKFLTDLAIDVDTYLKQLPIKPKELILDGGVTRSDFLVSKQSEVSKIPVRKQKTFDGTALGVAMLAKTHNG